MKTFKMLINAADVSAHINREVYGSFSEHLGRCIYGGLYVGEGSAIPNIHGIRKDAAEALKDVRLPVLRWPGGCFADEYHWKDGIGPKEGRRKMINTNWGGVVEDNSFGTHEFFELCELIGCEPYVAGNVGSGTVQELAEWVEYMTFDGVSPMAAMRAENGREKPWRLKYLGIGNENWGCGGNMEPGYYSNVYRQFASFCKDYSGNHLYKIACGPNAADYEWTETMMKTLCRNGWWQAGGISLHYYCVPEWNNKGKATEFDEEGYYAVLASANYIDTLLTDHGKIMDRYDPEGKVALIVDEWGTWFDVEEGTNPGFLFQQNTMRDAVVAGLTLNSLNRHASRVKMANIAQVVNVLQALLLTEGEKLVKTPTYHVFDLYKEHQDGECVYCFSENATVGAGGKELPMLSSSASVKDGAMTVTLSNCSLDDEAELCIDICNFEASKVSARVLTDEVHAHNTFEEPERVVIRPLEARLEGGQVKVTLPACSVAEIRLS
ncbi:MAG: alpha-N-arabinofuranosidase [Ruminococcus sp.]|nr:alpha-N-arabinofuranosidase [Ruminococcus sp.]